MEPIATMQLEEFARELAQMAARGETGVLAIVTAARGSAPGWTGAKMLILPGGQIRGTVGGGAFEARVIEDALGLLEQGSRAIHTRYDLAGLGMSCGGDMEVYLETLAPSRRVYVYGAGHVGSAVAQVLSWMGCRVRVVDDRAEWANPERLPEVAELAVCPFLEDIQKHPPCANDAVIIVTRGHQHDQQVLEQVIRHRPAFLGMIGSRRKAALSRKQLAEAGVPAEWIAQVVSPIGLAIGARTPKEIAISIAAQVVASWYGASVAQSALRQEEPA